MNNQERLNQVAAQLEAVAQRLRAGEDVGREGDLSAWWFDSDADGTHRQPDVGSAIRVARQNITDCRGGDGDPWAEDMEVNGWGLTVWVERAQAIHVETITVCEECDGECVMGPEDGGGVCDGCDGTGEYQGELAYRCNYELKPIPANAVLYQHRGGPETIEPDRGAS